MRCNLYGRKRRAVSFYERNGMLKRICAGLLLWIFLCSGATAQGMDIRLTAEMSEVLSDGALRALTTWLADAYLNVQMQQDAQEIALHHGDRLLLSAAANPQGAAVTAGEITAKVQPMTVDIAQLPAQATAAAESLGQLLKVYEKSAKATAELGGAVKAKTQLSYTLQAAEWAAVWPQVCDILGESLRGISLESKGTLRRYFDQDGKEVGAYFYAEKVRIAENDVREVRLEYGLSDSGLYLAFRCPNKNGTRNVRISITAKRTERSDRISYSLSGDVRVKNEDTQDTVTAEASLKDVQGTVSGKAAINISLRRNGKTRKYALEIKPEVTSASGSVAYAVDAGGQRVLEGKLMLEETAEKPVSLPEINGDETQVAVRLTRLLYDTLLDLPDSERLELMYYLNRSIFLTGDQKDISIMYDPEFTVTEVPE